MVSPDPEPSRRRITMGQWASEREVDLLERDADLDNIVFPVRTLDWHGGTPNDEQLVDVISSWQWPISSPAATVICAICLPL